MLAVFERFTNRLVERQREMYAADVPFLAKWRSAMGFMEEDLAAGLPEDLGGAPGGGHERSGAPRRFRAVYATWRSVLTDAFTDAAREYGVSDAAVPALVTLVMTFTIGMFNERLVGIEAGHAELLAWFEAAHPVDGAGGMTAAVEQTRARRPDESGDLDRHGVAIHWERYGEGEPRDPLPADLVDRPLAVLEGPDPVPRPPPPRARVRPAWQRRLSAACSMQPPTPRRRSPTTPSAVLDATGDRPAPWSSGLSLGAQRGLLLATEHPERVARRSSCSAPPLGARAAARPSAPRHSSGSARSATTRAVAPAQRALLAARLRGVPRVLLRRGVHGAALDEADRGLRRLGARGRSRLPARLRGRLRRWATARAEVAAAVGRPVLVIHGDEDAIVPHAVGRRARAPDGRLARHRRRRRPLSPGPRARGS